MKKSISLQEMPVSDMYHWIHELSPDADIRHFKQYHGGRPIRPRKSQPDKKHTNFIDMAIRENSSPGPAIYKVNGSMVLNKRKFTFGQKLNSIFTIKNPQGPGVGSYNFQLKKKKINQQRRSERVLNSQYFQAKARELPGPGQYNPHDILPKIAGPKLEVKKNGSSLVPVQKKESKKMMSQGIDPNLNLFEDIKKRKNNNGFKYGKESRFDLRKKKMGVFQHSQIEDWKLLKGKHVRSYDKICTGPSLSLYYR